MMVSAKYESSSVAICSLGSAKFFPAGIRWPLAALDSSKGLASSTRVDGDIVGKPFHRQKEGRLGLGGSRVFNKSEPVPYCSFISEAELM